MDDFDPSKMPEIYNTSEEGQLLMRDTPKGKKYFGGKSSKCKSNKRKSSKRKSSKRKSSKRKSYRHKTNKRKK